MATLETSVSCCCFGHILYSHNLKTGLLYYRIMTNKLTLSPGSIVLALGIVAFLLVVASVGGQLAPNYTDRSDPIILFSLDSEQNLPTFFSVLLLLFAALLLAVIAVFKKEQADSYALYWVVLSFGFLLMAVDEAMSIHEKLNAPMSQLLGEERLSVFHYAWVVPGIVFVVAVGLFFLKFLLHLPAKTGRLFLMAAVLYLGGVIIIELVGNHYAAVDGVESLSYLVSVTMEESLEMAGIIVFIFALLSYIAENYGEVRFRLHGGSGKGLHEPRLPKQFNTLIVSRNSESPISRSRTR